MSDDALIAKAAEAIREGWDPSSRMEWAEQHARAVIAAVRDQIAAEALRSTATKLHLAPILKREERAMHVWLSEQADARSCVRPEVNER